MYFDEVFSILESENYARHYKYTEFKDLSDNVKKEIEGRSRQKTYKNIEDLPENIRLNIDNDLNRYKNELLRNINKENEDQLTNSQKKDYEQKVKKYKENLVNKYCYYMKYYNKKNNIKNEVDNTKKDELISRHNMEEHKRLKQTRIVNKDEKIASDMISPKLRREATRKTLSLDDFSNYMFGKSFSKLSKKSKATVEKTVDKFNNDKIKAVNDFKNKRTRLVNIINDYPSNKNISDEEREEYLKIVKRSTLGNSSLEDKISKGSVLNHFKNNTRPSKTNDSFILKKNFLKKGNFDDSLFKKEVIRILNNYHLNPLIKTGDINNNNFNHILKVVKAGSKFSNIDLNKLSVSEKISKDSIIQNIDGSSSRKNSGYVQDDNEKKLFNTAALENEKTEEGYRLQQSSYYNNVRNLKQLGTNLMIFDRQKGNSSMPNFYIILNPGVVQPVESKNSLPLADGRSTKGIDGLGYVNGKIFFVENKSSDVINHYETEVSNFIKNCDNAKVPLAIWNYSGSWNSTALKEFQDDSTWGLTIDKAKEEASLKNSKHDFRMMSRQYFNDWLVKNNISSVKVSSNDSNLTKGIVTEYLKRFLNYKKINWKPSDKRRNAKFI